jgi:hypothetical protein
MPIETGVANKLLYIEYAFRNRLFVDCLNAFFFYLYIFRSNNEAKERNGIGIEAAFATLNIRLVRS